MTPDTAGSPLGDGLVKRSLPDGVCALPDPTAKKDEGWVAVQTGAGKVLPKAVTLAAVKAEPKLKEMALVKYGRLSVQPVTADQWKLVCKMGGLK